MPTIQPILLGLGLLAAGAGPEGGPDLAQVARCCTTT